MKFSSANLFNFITKANQILFFIGIIIIAGLLVTTLLRELFRESYYDPGIKVVDDKQSEQPQRVEYEKSFITKLDDIMVFAINAKSIRLEKPKRNSVLGVYNSFGGDDVEEVNLLFIEGEKKVKLFENDKLILSRDFAGTPSEFERYSTTKNIYKVVESDTNNDGFLNNDDSLNLYVSSVNGENLELIQQDISYFRLIGDDLILIEKGEDTDQLFFQYDLKENTLTSIDTSF